MIMLTAKGTITLFEFFQIAKGKYKDFDLSYYQLLPG